MPAVFVSPKLVICLDCGLTEFTLPESKFRPPGRIAIILVSFLRLKFQAAQLLSRRYLFPELDMESSYGTK